MVLPHYTHKLTASWADMDFNAHMANAAYLNRAVDARMAFFTENGLPLAELMRLRVSWVMMKDEVELAAHEMNTAIACFNSPEHLQGGF
jgi:acyl-CoA thioesterase FadM